MLWHAMLSSAVRTMIWRLRVPLDAGRDANPAGILEWAHFRALVCLIDLLPRSRPEQNWVCADHVADDVHDALPPDREWYNGEDDRWDSIVRHREHR